MSTHNSTKKLVNKQDSKVCPNYPLNYLFFGFFFVVLLGTSLYNLFLAKSSPTGRYFFAIQALLQSGIETLLLIDLLEMIRKKRGRPSFFLAIGAIFVLLLTHLCDFILIRILDLSFWDYLGILLDENWDNLLQMLYASGVPLNVWGLFFLTLGLIPLVGISIYLILNKLCIKPLLWNGDKTIYGLLGLVAALFIWDIYGSRCCHLGLYHHCMRTLPWKTTLFTKKTPTLYFLNTQDNTRDAGTQTLPLIDQKPNIYLFITESLRRDFLNEQTAPHLTAFQQANLSFPFALSSSNATQKSWFSLFYAEPALNWKVRHEAGYTGAPSLALLKQLGYKIHVFSAAELYYYEMDRHLFGKDHHLTHSFYLFPHHYPIRSSKSDQTVIELATKQLLKNGNQGNLYLFFLDSTHFDYSWEEDHQPKFFPFSSETDYFKLHHTIDDVERIKNRYRNAVSFIDHLFGRFISSLQQLNFYEEAVILFTGDHGEEFYEEGKLFHTSHLSHAQTAIPLFCKFGNNQRPINTSLPASHIDIFPTLIDHICKQEIPLGSYRGRSLFAKDHPSFAITSRHNGSRDPTEFCLTNGQLRLYCRLTINPHLGLKEVNILSLRDQHDHFITSTLEIQKTIHIFYPALIQTFGN